MINEILKELGIDVNSIDSSHGDVYELTMNDDSQINLYIDEENWLHVMSEFICGLDEEGNMYKQIAWFNDFNVSHPQVVMGVNKDNEKIVLHSRFHCENRNRINAIEFFESFTMKLNEIKNIFKR